MKHLFNHFFLLATLLFFPIFFSCTSTLLLSENFDAYGVDRPIGAGFIPGEPDGDKIAVEENFSWQRAPIQRDDHGNNWLGYSYITHGEPFDISPRLSFAALPTTYPASISYFWKMKIVNEGPVSNDIAFDLTDGVGNANVCLLLQGSRRSPAPEPNFHLLYLEPSHELLGKIPDSQICEFWVMVDHSANTFTMLVTRPTVPEGSIDIGDHALCANSTAGMKNPTFQIYQKDYGAHATTKHTSIIWLDQIMIHHKR